jgi:hypothetical protein
MQLSRRGFLAAARREAAASLGGVPSLTVDSGHGKPDVSVRQWGLEPVAEPVTSGTSVLEPDLEASVAFRLDPQRALHVDSHGQLVAALEIVSPRNKDCADAKETYTNRYLGYLRLGVHLLPVDVLPRPRGFSFSDAITRSLGPDLPPLPPPFAAAYRVGEVVPVGDDMGSPVGLWRRPLRVSQPPPTLPDPLGVHQAVPIELEVTYRRAAKRVYLVGQGPEGPARPAVRGPARPAPGVLAGAPAARLAVPRPGAWRPPEHRPRPAGLPGCRAGRWHPLASCLPGRVKTSRVLHDA